MLTYRLIFLRPLKGASHSFLPAFQLLAAFFGGHVRGKFLADLPVLFYFGCVFPEAGGKAGKIGCAKGGSFDAAWADYLGVQEVGLELHEEVVGAGAAVYAEGAKVKAGTFSMASSTSCTW